MACSFAGIQYGGVGGDEVGRVGHGSAEEVRDFLAGRYSARSGVFFASEAEAGGKR